MSITTKKPPIKESIGAQYVCFDQSENDEYSGTYSEEVEKTEVVKSVKVTENAEKLDQCRSEFAHTILERYLSDMAELGYTKTQAAEYVKEGSRADG